MAPDQATTTTRSPRPRTAAALPLRLRAGLPVLWRGPTEVQVGTDPRWAVALADLTPSAARALAAVPAGATFTQVRAQLADEDVSAEEVDAVLAGLRTSRLAVRARGGEPWSDDEAWSLMSPDGDASELAYRRSRATVRICGLGRLGAGLTLVLAAAGVGVLELDDDAMVTREDVGLGGLTARDVGSSRRGAVARAVHDAAPDVRVVRPAHRPVDLVVLVERDVADPVRYRPLVRDDVAHLSVVVHEASVTVGPLVRPGASACLHCVDLHRADADPAWPAVAAQLAARARPLRREETTLAAVAASVAAVQVLAHLDGRVSAVHDAALELRLPDVVPRRRSWPSRPDCGCRGLPAADADDPAGREVPARAGSSVGM